MFIVYLLLIFFSMFILCMYFLNIMCFLFKCLYVSSVTKNWFEFEFFFVLFIESMFIVLCFSFNFFVLFLNFFF